jgi:hypothetical protein
MMPMTQWWLLTFAYLTVSVGVAAQGSLHFEAPPNWTQIETSSPLRVAEFGLPRSTGDSEDAKLVVYDFSGEGGVGENNFEQWTNQMLQPDGRSSSDVATTTSFEVNGMSVTILDVPGIYSAEVQPGSNVHYYKRGFRLKATVVETPAGPYFFKLTGPNRTVTESKSDFNALLATINFQ